MSDWQVQSETPAPQTQPAQTNQPAQANPAQPTPAQPTWEVAGEKPAPDYLSKTEDAIQSGVTHAGNIGENFLKSAENTSAGIADLAEGTADSQAHACVRAPEGCDEGQERVGVAEFTEGAGGTDANPAVLVFEGRDEELDGSRIAQAA